MSNRFLTLVIIVLLIWNIFLTGSIATLGTSQNNHTDNVVIEVNGISTDFTSIVESNRAGVVSIVADGIVSSGFVYGQDGDDAYVVTAYHGIDGAFKVDVIFDNNYRVTSEVLGYDIYSDLAVLKVNTPYQMTVLDKGVSENIAAGSFLVSVGTKGSSELASSVELGMVANKLRTIMNTIDFDGYTYEYFSSLIQMTANLSNGFSGGPLFDVMGDVVGIVTMKEDGETIYAFPMDEAAYIIDGIIAGTGVNKISLGIKGSYVAQMPTYKRSSLSLSIDDVEGFYVERMTANSRAYLFGIREGDVILSINDTVLRDNRDLLRVLYGGGENLEFRILRNNEKTVINGAAHD